MGGLGGFRWEAVHARLAVYGLSTPEIDEKLGICEAALLKVEADLRDEDDAPTEDSE